MGGFARAPEDRPTPPEVVSIQHGHDHGWYLCLPFEQYNWRVYMAALVISMGVLAYGYGQHSDASLRSYLV